ncbi:MAG: NUDIX hydrolase [Lachnospiraceae bacterium]|nr:NUDIX hydrolase [Lachnospiraceae bacterium]
MINHIISAEEKKFLKNYDITAYDRPSLTADMAVFAIRSGSEQPEYRKDPEKRLGVLLIRRGGHPYKDCYGLPGGFAQKQESIEETAKRELKEETSVDNAFLEPFGIFSRKGRDPRGWIVSNAFLALVDAEKYRVRPGSDAWEAAWFFIDLEVEESKKHVRRDSADITTLYRLKLEKEDVTISALVKETRSFAGHLEKTGYEILEDEGFAFDHAEIIVRALIALRERTARSGRIVFDLMPEYFTLYNLQEAHEIILGEKLLTPNFRRKMAPFVTETSRQVETGAGHRPARLYQRNMEAFYDKSFEY